ncbi:rhamnan synthesis F family protein [Methylobacterium sp. P31]
MKAAVISHFDLHGLVDDHVMYSLRCYRPYFDYIIFVSTANLEQTAQLSVLSLADRVVVRRNVGYDFLSWRVGFEMLPMRNVSEVTFINDSIYGPCSNLEKFFLKGRSLGVDLWGATLSRQFRPHVQSFFMTFSSSLLSSGFARWFWSGVGILASKSDIIQNYEIGLSRLVESHGFTIGGVVDLNDPSQAIRQLAYDDNFGLNASLNEGTKNYIFKDNYPNPTQLFWARTLSGGSPFVKVELLRDNPLLANRGAVLKKLRDDGWYDPRLILRHLERVMPSEKFRLLIRDAESM